MARALFVSDIHLKSPDEPNARALLGFLERVCNEHDPEKRATHLFLVGDIFDLWIGGHLYFRHKFHALVHAIERLKRAGVEIHYFEGNHDLHLTRFWQDQLGAKVHTDHAYFELSGQRVRVEHGDLINPDDRGYLFLRWLLRTWPVRFLALNLPAAAVSWIGERASRLSRHHTSTAKAIDQDRIRSMTRLHAQKAFAERPFDLIVTGHVHVVDDFSFDVEGEKVRSVNLGAWFDGRRIFELSRTQAGFIELE